MAFKNTGRKLKPQDESFLYCDQCDKCLSIDAYKMQPNWSLTYNPEDPYDDGSLTETVYFCSTECVAKWISSKQVTRLVGPANHPHHHSPFLRRHDEPCAAGLGPQFSGG